MPKYCYKCPECEGEYEVRHGMTERLETCKVCEYEGVLTRIPQLTTTIKKQEQNGKVGSLVKEYIEKNKETLREEKKNRIVYDE